MRIKSASWFIVCLAVVFMLTACCEDDDDSPNPPDKITVEHLSGNDFKVTFSRSDTTGGQGPWTITDTMVATSTPDSAMPDLIIMYKDTTGGQ